MIPSQTITRKRSKGRPTHLGNPEYEARLIELIATQDTKDVAKTLGVGCSTLERHIKAIRDRDKEKAGVLDDTRQVEVETSASAKTTTSVIPNVSDGIRERE